MKAFVYWYTLAPNDRTIYLHVIAYTEKQAWFYFSRYLYEVVGHWYDYDKKPAYIIEQYNFIRHHACGDILGENAII